MISISALKTASLAGLVAGAALAACASGPAFAQTADKIPDLASSSLAWTPQTVKGTIARYGTGWFDPPAGMRGPIKQDPDHPLRGNRHRPSDSRAGQLARPDPQALGGRADAGLERGIAVRQSRHSVPGHSQCWPGGTPGQLLWTSERLFFVQTPKEVWMIWQRDWVRRIFMTDQHSQDVKPSWYGESIGHYENGELVVDTIGLTRTSRLPRHVPHPAHRKAARGGALQARRPTRNSWKPWSRSRTPTLSTSPCT